MVFDRFRLKKWITYAFIVQVSQQQVLIDTPTDSLYSCHRRLLHLLIAINLRRGQLQETTVKVDIDMVALDA